ncbi:NAD-dependent epimerase/dehydratase [Methylobacterium sp. 4-46]|uniref:NAD-dependent epimerase/dehydratase family protein n=1 Tax=unclassified Methylobacterium TaxID=2615210 RepID=UPI000152CD85|nr:MULTISPECIES: NAD(P)-dependent oxidoreductase [Methylobacterium]ACA19031.1 NAD-dependent epimerase/dehydratase [Methylobacterium sp. 4-46]WFT78245.1 NAD(P)-dependent oxidoreductase [Methylobacterium nodulans]
MTSIDLDKLRGARVLVFGATGFLGQHLVRALVSRGARVTGASRSADPGHRNLGAEWHRCDASDAEQVAAVFRAVRPDIVYQLTSDSRGGQELTLIPDSLRNDVIATTNVLTEATRHSIGRMVMTGSLEEPKGSADDAVPSSPYAAAKWVSCGYARMFASLYELPVTTLRLMMTYGPGQKDYKVIPYTIQTLLEGRTAQLSQGDRLLDWVYVDDVIDAFLRAGIADLSDVKPIEIGTGKATRLCDLLKIIGELMGKPDLLAFGNVPNRLMEREQIADPIDAAKKLDWFATTPLRQGLLSTIEAIQMRGGLLLAVCLSC